MTNKVSMCQEIEIGSKFYQQAAELRYELFFKEHKLPESIVFDKYEAVSTHIVIAKEAELIAYGRLSKTDADEYIISQMVVSPVYQHQGYASKVLARLIQLALEGLAKRISLEARIQAIGLYEKQGFITQGQVYSSSSTGVPHIKMVHRAVLDLQ